MESCPQIFFEIAPLGFIALDLTHVVQEINATGAQLFGAEKRSLIGRPFLLWLEDTSRGVYEDFYQQTLKKGQLGSCEMKFLKKDGSGFEAILECLANPYDGRSRVNHYMFAMNDVSQLVSLEKRLDESKAAVKVLIEQRAEDRMELEKNILSNVRQLIMPHVEKLRQAKLTEDQAQHIQLIKANIDNLISPFLRRLSAIHGDLTSREIEISKMVLEGYITKEISALLYISTRSVEFHKDNIRKKMGLTNKKINLRSYLLSLDAN